jgi:hypothetical protein
MVSDLNRKEGQRALTRSVKVLRFDLAEIGDCLAHESTVLFVLIPGDLSELNVLNGREVSRTGALVEEGHLTVPLKVGHPERALRLVHGELLVVGADTVTVGVRVREQTCLQNGVRTGLDAGYHMRRVECGLFDFCEIILI